MGLMGGGAFYLFTFTFFLANVPYTSAKAAGLISSDTASPTSSHVQLPPPAQLNPFSGPLFGPKCVWALADRDTAVRGGGRREREISRHHSFFVVM